MDIKYTLVVDIGNTKAKAAIFQQDDLVQKVSFEAHDAEKLNNLIQMYAPTHSLLCSVGEEPENIIALLKANTTYFQLTHHLQVPFFIDYQTPETLGMDRVAAVAGAQHFFLTQPCLVIDMGTCVTYDFLTADYHYLGGAISPGFNMRLRAMHEQTQRLPLLEVGPVDDFVGKTTKESMLSGAFFGLLGEINDTIARYEERFGEIRVLLCGGDAPLFDKHTKKSIFAAPDLVLFGLHKILQLHAT
jgi:type III pantothenate kinase